MRTWNVISNAAYALVGAMAWLTWGFDPFVLACLVLAAGSAAFHYFHDDKRFEYWAQHADELGMYMLFSALALGYAELLSWPLAAAAWIGLHFAALTFSARQTLAVLAAFILGCLLKDRMFLEMLLCLGLLGGAYYMRRYREAHERFGAGHVAWHAWTAAMIGLLYVFLK